jgi:type 1 fimbriae regulatory protein FimB
MPRLRLITRHPKSHRKVQSRIREKIYLTDGEVQTLMHVARQGRHGVRNQLLILLAWRHGLRVSELVGITLNQVNLESRELYLIRVKGSVSNHHPLSEEEVQLLKRWLAVRKTSKGSASASLFLNERGEGMQPHAFNHLLKTLGTKAGFTCALYPHILRHSCGYHLAGKGHDAFRIAAYLGHKNVQNAVRYTHASAYGFKSIW